MSDYRAPQTEQLLMAQVLHVVTLQERHFPIWRPHNLQSLVCVAVDDPHQVQSVTVQLAHTLSAQ